MYDTLKIKDLSISRLLNNELLHDLPEVYRLKGTIEKNLWHDHESVFDHTMNVLRELEQIKAQAPQKVKMYLMQDIDDNSQWDILYVAGLLHDIAKQYTKTMRKGESRFPDHEKEGAEFAKQVIGRIYLSDLEGKLVRSIIAHHGDLHGIVRPDNKILEEQYETVMDKYPDIAIELCMLSLADTASCSALRRNNPVEYDFRIGFYRARLENF